MNNNQVCHLWANQQTHMGKGSNLFFEDETIYSYGLHFPIATFTDKFTNDGTRLVLFNARSYSVTTGKHKGLVRSALQGLNVRVIDVPHLDCLSHAENMYHFMQENLSVMVKAKRARTRVESYVKQAQSLQNDAIAYARAFGLAIPEWASIGIDPVLVERAIETSKQNAANRKAREAREALEQTEKVIKWLAGENVSIGNGNGDTLLRVKADRIETSRGAQVTLKNAHRLYRIVSDARGTPDSHRKYAVIDMPQIDGFQLKTIHENGDIQVGCHFIKWEEIARIAAQMEWAQ